MLQLYDPSDKQSNEQNAKSNNTKEVQSSLNAYITGGEEGSLNSQIGLRGMKERSRTNHGLAKTIAQQESVNTLVEMRKSSN